MGRRDEAQLQIWVAAAAQNTGYLQSEQENSVNKT